MLKEDHGAGQLAAFVLQQFRTAYGEYGDCGEQLAQPAGSAGIERQDAAAGPAGKIEEQLGVPACRPVGRIVEDEKPDALAPKFVRKLAATCGRFLKDIADVGDDPGSGRGERAREDRQELRVSGTTGDGCGAVAKRIRVSGEFGKGVQAGAAVHGEGDIEFAGERAHEGVGDFARRGPGWLTGCGGVKAEDEPRASWHRGGGERGWVRRR